MCIHHRWGESNGLSVALEMMEAQTLAFHMHTDSILSAGTDPGIFFEGEGAMYV